VILYDLDMGYRTTKILTGHNDAEI